MTRIITETYKCAHCGNELHRKKVTSVSTFMGHGDLLSSHSTFSGINPRLYFCDQCGYIGRDLSIKPDEKALEVINDKDYQNFMKIGFKYDLYFQHFLLGYTYLKLGKYTNAIPHFVCSINGGHQIFANEKALEDGYILNNDELEFDVVVNNSNDPENLFVNYLITKCVEHIDYKDITYFLTFYESIDALRRVGKPEKALVLIKLALDKGFNEEQISLLKKEEELCLITDVLTIINNPFEDEYSSKEEA